MGQLVAPTRTDELESAAKLAPFTVMIVDPTVGQPTVEAPVASAGTEEDDDVVQPRTEVTIGATGYVYESALCAEVAELKATTVK